MTHSPHPNSARPGARLALASPATSALAQAATLILTTFAQFVFAHFHVIGTEPGIALHRRITRAYKRFQLILALAALGKEPRQHTPRPTRAQTTKRPKSVLPRRRGWGSAMFGHHATAYGSQLNHLLNQPETIALLRAAPARTRIAAARAVRPILHMFAWDLPDVLQRPGPPRPRPKRAPAARSARGAVQETPRRRGKYPRFNPLTYSPGKMPIRSFKHP